MTRASDRRGPAHQLSERAPASIEAVRGISFALGRERLGIVGESGSGKSQTGRAILGLTPRQAEVSAEQLDFDGIDLLAANAARCGVRCAAAASP